MAKQRRRKTGQTTRDLGLGQVGKSSQPRNCFSQSFRRNYDEINWHREREARAIEVRET